MSRTGDTAHRPRAMIHRRILDAAASRPDASVAALAEEVSGATPSLVERVLDEYGDPADEDGDQAKGGPVDVDAATSLSAAADGSSTGAERGDAPEAVAGPTAQGDGAPPAPQDDDAGTDGPETDSSSGDTDHGNTTMPASSTQANGSVDSQTGDLSLSEKQAETLRAVYDDTSATQEELAERLDVTRATISRRLNAIPGFEWGDRQAFAAAVFEGDDAPPLTTADEGTDADGADDAGDETASGSPEENESPTGDGETAVLAAVRRLDDRLAALEDADGAGEDGRTDESADEATTATVSLTPELAHKVLTACMESDRITDDEEVELVRSLVEG